MKYGFNSLGILITLTFGYGSVFGADIPNEIKELRDKAIANSMEVSVSAEKLKANYTILEAKENAQTATYKVADMPKKGVHATVIYRENLDDTHKVTLEVGDPPKKANSDEYKAWRAALHEKWLNFPKPFPESVVCVDEKAGIQTKYVFEKGALSVYLRHYDELTRVDVMRFHGESQIICEFYRVQNNSATGLRYFFDEKGDLTKTVDYGPPPAERRSSIQWDEYRQPFMSLEERREMEAFFEEMQEALEKAVKEMLEEEGLPNDG